MGGKGSHCLGLIGIHNICRNRKEILLRDYKQLGAKLKSRSSSRSRVGFGEVILGSERGVEEPGSPNIGTNTEEEESCSIGWTLFNMLGPVSR